MKLRIPKQLVALFAAAVLFLGGALLLVQLQQQQRIKQFAWQVAQSADASCSTDNNTAVINVSFTNHESEKSIDVTAKDLQTGKSVDLGTAAPGENKQDTLVTDHTSLNAGSVAFFFKWTDNSPGNDTATANYKAVT